MEERKVKVKEPTFLKVCKSFIRLIEYVILLFMLLFIIVMLLNINNKDEIKSIFGYKFFILNTDSMKPTLAKNDLIIIKKDTYEKNDIVTFLYEDSYVTYRIKDFNEEGNYILKPDNSENNLSITVNDSEIIGKYVFKFNKVGILINLLINNIIICFGIIVIIIILIIVRVVKRIKAVKKEERNKSRLQYMMSHK